jgi:hypothetical protein
MRPWAAALAIALAGCAGDDSEILVLNQGSQDVIVDVEIDAGWRSGDDDLAVVPAGGIYKEDFPSADEVDVFITRRSDGMILYAASFDRKDFEDEHGTIEIIVAP